jgi:predicted permease
MEHGSLLTLQGQLFLLIVVGALAKRTGIIGDSGKRVLADLVLYITLPCATIRSFVVDVDTNLFNSLVHALLIGIVVALTAFLLSRLLFRSVENQKAKVLRYAILVSNAGFFGLPIASEVFGPMGYMFASLFLTPLRVLMWSEGVAIFRNKQNSDRPTLRQVFLNPNIIAVYMGLILMITRSSLPTVVDNTLATIGGTTTTLSMLLIGSLFGEMKLADLSFEFDFFLHSAIRLLLIPSLTYIVGKFIGADRVVCGVAVLLAGMPAGSSAVILATKYNGDAGYASRLVLMSTLLSLFTLPVWMALLSK